MSTCFLCLEISEGETILDHGCHQFLCLGCTDLFIRMRLETTTVCFLKCACGRSFDHEIQQEILRRPSPEQPTCRSCGRADMTPAESLDCPTCCSEVCNRCVDPSLDDGSPIRNMGPEASYRWLRGKRELLHKPELTCCERHELQLMRRFTVARSITRKRLFTLGEVHAQRALPHGSFVCAVCRGIKIVSCLKGLINHLQQCHE